MSMDVWHDDTGINPSWHVTNIILVDTERYIRYTFALNTWFIKSDKLRRTIKYEKKGRNIFLKNNELCINITTST